MAHACFSSSVQYTSHSCVLSAFRHAVTFPNLAESSKFTLDRSISLFQFCILSDLVKQVLAILVCHKVSKTSSQNGRN